MKIEIFEPGSIVFLKSDIGRKRPMVVEKDETKDVPADDVSLDELLSKTYTGPTIKKRNVYCEWFNSQGKVENRPFNPEVLVQPQEPPEK